MTLLLLLFSITCFSQTGTNYFKNYKDSDGLSCNTISAILQDKKGFIWVGTHCGLNRFDGVNFRTFRNNPADSLSIGNDFVLSLYEDRSGRIWVGTMEGIYLYDPIYERFVAFNLPSKVEAWFIKGDMDGNIWIVGSFQLYKYNPATRSLKRYNAQKEKIVTLHISDTGVIWTANSSGSVSLYDGKNDRFVAFYIPSLYSSKTLEISDISSVGDSSLLIGTTNAVLLLNTRTKSLIDIFKTYKLNSNVYVSRIFRMNSGEHWVGSETGIFVINWNSKRIVHIEKQAGNPYSISDDVITSFCGDREGGVWVGTRYGGVNYHSPQYNNFKKHFPGLNARSLSGGVIREICKDKYDNMWIATEDGGLSQLELETGQVVAYQQNNQKGSINSNRLLGLLPIGDELWIGTYDQGLDIMDVRTRKVIRHYEASTKPGALSSNFILALYKTKRNEILIGTALGLFKYNPGTDSFIKMPLPNVIIQSLYEDHEETLWVGTYGYGIYYLNRKTGKIGHIANTKKDGLPSNYVNAVYQAADGQFWFATENGLSRYIPNTKKIINYTVADGLPDIQVYRILEDSSGYLWVSTAHGLAMLDPESEKFTNYYISDRQLPGQFNYNSSYRDNDGTLFFGTISGMISFKPSVLVKNSIAPPVYFTGVRIYDRDVNVNSRWSPLAKSIMCTDSITLPYDSSNISVDVAVLSYTAPELNNYSYQMQGLDEHWITMKKERRINFPKLSPGKYILRVKGANSDQFWNDEETKLYIEILPPFWATKLAYVLYFVTGACVILYILKRYHDKQRQRNLREIERLEIQKEKELYSSKVDFLSNIAHEIKTPLSLIKGPLELLMENSDNVELNRKNLLLMERNTKRLIELSNQILDFRQTESKEFKLHFVLVNVSLIVMEVYENFQNETIKRKIDFEINLPEQPVYVDADEMGIYKIIANLFSNAVKYCDTMVKASLYEIDPDTKTIRLEISNDGPLIPWEMREKIFDPFVRLHDASRNTKGTGIGLAISKSLTILHGGRLFIEEGRANMFILVLPAGRQKVV